MGALEDFWSSNEVWARAVRALADLVGCWLAGHVLAAGIRAFAERKNPALLSLRGPVRALLVVLGLHYAREELPVGSPRLHGFIDGVLYLLAVAVATFAVIRLASLSVTAFVDRLGEADRHRLEQSYLPLVRKIVGLLAFTIGLLIAFHHFGVDVTGVVTTLGVGGLAVGFAAKETLSNMIAGFTLLLDRPFRPSDRIRLATGEVGDVIDIGIRSTRIRMLDHNLLVVPNAELTNSRIVNYNQPTSRGVGKVEIRIPFEADVAPAERVMLEAAAGIPAIVEPPKPSVALTRFGDSGLELALTFVVAEFADQAAIEDKLRRDIHRRLAEAKIALARPQIEVTLVKEPR